MSPIKKKERVDLNSTFGMSFFIFIMWFNKPELLLTEYDVGIGIFPMKKCHGWRWMCVNPFPSIPGSLFAYSGHNESLIHRCHLQPTVTLSRMNSWSSGEGTKDFRSTSPIFVSLRTENHRSVYLLTWWVISNKDVSLQPPMHVVLIVFCIFLILLSLLIPRPPS